LFGLSLIGRTIGHRDRDWSNRRRCLTVRRRRERYSGRSSSAGPGWPDGSVIDRGRDEPNRLLVGRREPEDAEHALGVLDVEEAL
jgi:hypothetical protein